MRRLLGLFGGVVTVLSLLGGCAEGSDPSVTLSLAQERLYQQAFEVYEKYFELTYALEQQGGTEVLPDEMRQYLMGPGLEEIEKKVRSNWESGFYFAGTNTYVITSWQRGSDPEPGTPAFMTIETCRRHVLSDLMNPDGTLQTAARDWNVFANVQFAKDVDDTIKVYYVDAEVVETCEL